MIVAIEGIDASGKATQTKALWNYFTDNADEYGLDKVRRHDFPHYASTAGGCVGRIIRGETIIASAKTLKDLDERDDYMDHTALPGLWSRDKAIIIQSVMIADRLEHLELLSEFAFSPDNLLILDRYKMSGYAYGVADGLEGNWLRTVQSGIPDADLNILIDITVNQSKVRRPERRDYYETNYDKLEQVRNLYLDRFGFGKVDGDYVVVHGEGDENAITAEIAIIVAYRLRSIST